MEDAKYCVYFHINPIKQEVFYVGIGNPKRPHSKSDRSSWWKKVVKKYHYDVIILHQNLTWGEVCKLEKQYIAQIGRRDKSLGSLVNLTDGGDGGITRIGFKQSEITKAKISKANKGRPCSNEQKQKLHIAHIGKKHSEAHKIKLRSKAKKGVPRTQEIKTKISESNKGRFVSFETKQKIAETLTGRKQSEETKIKRNKTLKGRKLSDEQKQKMKLIWVIRKQK